MEESISQKEKWKVGQIIVEKLTFILVDLWNNIWLLIFEFKITNLINLFCENTLNTLTIDPLSLTVRIVNIQQSN